MSASRVPRSIRITQRDRAIISDVARFGAASRAQLMELGHFRSVSRANRRLRLLTERKYVRRTFCATGACQAATVYVIGPEGTSVAVEDYCLDPVELRRQGHRMPERMYLEHHLGVLSLCLNARRTSEGIRLRTFLSEPECRHEYQVMDRGRTFKRLMKPDAMALFECGDRSLPVFFEFDRGHTSLPQMAALFGRYNSYWTDTAFQTAYGLEEPFTVAVVTTAGNRRIDHLVGLIGKSSVSVKFTTVGLLVEHGVDSDIWRSAETAAPTCLWEVMKPGGSP